MSGIEPRVQGFLDRSREAAPIVGRQPKGAKRESVGSFPVSGETDQAVGVVLDLVSGFMTVVGKHLAAERNREALGL